MGGGWPRAAVAKGRKIFQKYERQFLLTEPFRALGA